MSQAQKIFRTYWSSLLTIIILCNATFICTQDKNDGLVEQPTSEIVLSERSLTETQSVQDKQPELTPDVIKNIELFEQNCHTLLRLSHELNYLTIYINNSYIKSLQADQKIAINTLVKDLNNFINQILRDKPVLITEFVKNNDTNFIMPINYKIACVCSAIAQHMNNLLISKLHDVQPFNFENLATRSVPLTLSIEDIEKDIVRNQKRVTALRNKIDTAGLTWYNKVARTFDDKVVTPWQKYGLSKGLKVLSVTGIVGALALWEFGSFYKQSLYRTFLSEQNEKLSPHEIDQFTLKDHKSYLKKFELQEKNLVISLTNTLERFMGKRIPTLKGLVDDHAQMNVNPASYGKFSHFARFLENGLAGHSPLLWMIGGYALLNYKTILYGNQNDKQDAITGGLYGWLSKQTELAWNFARGGLHEVQKVDGMWDFNPTITFDDVIGLDEAKVTLSEILDFIENMDMHMNINIAPEMGYLLTGPTRTGKTYVFEALCGEIVRLLERMGKPANTFKFKILPAEHILQFGIKTILEWAKSEAPMILFIDEIDLLNLNRIGNAPLLAEFLTALGSAFNKDPKKPVIIISATNKPENLDIALRQGGRLGKEIRFERPSLAIRKHYLAHQFNKMAIDASQFDLDMLAQKTPGNSIEELHLVISSAIRHSWMFGKMLSQDLLEHCINTQLRKILQFSDKQLSENEQKIIAVHFAGKALAHIYLPLINQIDLVTTKPILVPLEEEVTVNINITGKKHNASPKEKVQLGGIFTLQKFDSANFKAYDLKISEIKLLVAGFVAEELLFGQCAYTCHAQDHERAQTLAREIIFGGLDPKQLAKKDLEDLLQKSYALLKKCKEEVKILLSEHLKALSAIAEALQEYQELNGIMVQFIVDIAEGKIDIEKLRAEYEAEQAKTAHMHTPDNV